MKAKFKSSIAFALIFALLFSPNVYACDTSKKHNSEIIAATNIVGGIIDGAFSLLGAMFPKMDFPTLEEYQASESESFYKGTEEFLDYPAEYTQWCLGFGSKSIVPDNLKNGTKEYYTGGYFTQKVNGVYDEQRANAIALNDSSGRGSAIFATVDGIGVGNADIRAIRSRCEEKLKNLGIKSDINAININSTHCHTVIDTQGFNLNLIGKAFQNMFSFLPFLDVSRSIDEEFLEVMIDGTSDAIVEAYLNMEKGELYYCETSGIGKSEDEGIYTEDEYEYLLNKRYHTEGYQHAFACFKFVPDNKNSKATVFANLGAHPTTIERSTSLLSSDFPNYIGEKINEAGMNFMFIQGAQSPISVRKDGVKTASVVNEVEKEIENDSSVGDYKAAKTLGYEFARLILSALENPKKVDPILNVKMSEIAVKLDRGLLQLGAATGLLGTTTVYDKSSKTGYSIITEVGYIEIGTDIVILTVPGELVPQLVYGNVVSAEDSYLGEEWKIECTVDLIDENKTVLVMGLCNDAIGYIIPDNDYAHFIADSLWNIDGAEKLFGEYHRHYEEMLSTGSAAASTVMTALNELVKSEN